MGHYISKKARAAQQAYLDHQPENLYLTQKEIAQRFPDLKIEQPKGTTFMWNDFIIFVKPEYKPVIKIENENGSH